MSVRGAGGAGSEVESFRMQTKESEGNEASQWEEKRVSGSLPVEENNDTMLGCTEAENMLSGNDDYADALRKGLRRT